MDWFEEYGHKIVKFEQIFLYENRLTPYHSLGIFTTTVLETVRKLLKMANIHSKLSIIDGFIQIN